MVCNNGSVTWDYICFIYLSYMVLLMKIYFKLEKENVKRTHSRRQELLHLDIKIRRISSYQNKVQNKYQISSCAKLKTGFLSYSQVLARYTLGSTVTGLNTHTHTKKPTTNKKHNQPTKQTTTHTTTNPKSTK